MRAGPRSDHTSLGTRGGQFLEFVRTIDAKFVKYDAEGEVLCGCWWNMC